MRNSRLLQETGSMLETLAYKQLDEVHIDRQVYFGVGWW